MAEEHAHRCPDPETNQTNTYRGEAQMPRVRILRHTSPVTDTPVDGTTYVATDTIGSATVMYVGTGTSYADTGLTNDTTYYYAIHSYDGNNQYSNGVKLFGEPTRHENKQRIALHQYHGCALDHNNAPYCWGENWGYPIGNGIQTDSSIPLATDTTDAGWVGSKEFVHITAGDSTSCGITKDNNLWCWGYNHEGQMGQGNTTSAPTPVQVTGSWRTTSAETVGWAYDDNRPHMCAINTTGDLYCSGYNNHGELGLGNTTVTHVMTKTLGGLKWKSVTAGALHTCGVTMEGEGLCWGYNAQYQLGEGTTTNRHAPFSVPQTSSGRNCQQGIQIPVASHMMVSATAWVLIGREAWELEIRSHLKPTSH